MLSQALLFVNGVLVSLVLLHFDSQHGVWYVRLLNIHVPVSYLALVKALARASSGPWRVIGALPSIRRRSSAFECAFVRPVTS